MPLCLISLGSNLGDRRQTLDLAVAELASNPQLRIERVSRWYETAPVGGPAGQPAFLNGAVLLEAALSPLALLDLLQDIERRLGRERGPVRWSARTLDLDLLL